MSESEVVTAIAFSIALLESELPETFKRKRLSPWQKEIVRHVAALRVLHRRLSPMGDRLKGLDQPDGREIVKSNFNCIDPGPGW